MDYEAMQLGVVDLVVFLGIIGLAVAVGIYYAVVDRKKSVDNYYYGGRSMSPIPVGLSIAASFISAITVIGIPAETYLYGIVMFWFGLTGIVPNIIACLYYIPLIHRLRLATINEYLELRFRRYNRQLVSSAYVVSLIFFLGMTVYVPSLALNAVTPLDLTTTIVISSLACTFYTTLGGMKAVIWTDTIQTFAMVAGGLGAMIRALMNVGGLENALAVAHFGKRLNFWNFNPDPTLRYTVWSFVFGHAIGMCGLCVNQSNAQRYLSCKNVKQARIAALISVIPAVFLMGTAVATGVAMYAYYEGCDPLALKKIEKSDQMLPYMVVDVFQDLPGMAGLFVAAAYSGTLSSVSSGLNSLAVVFLHDFILAMKPNLSQALQLTLSKIFVFLLGLVILGMALAISIMKATVLRITYSLTSVIGGPLIGVFTLGVFFPWVTAKGALIGQICGTGITGWIAYGSLLQGKISSGNKPLPLSTDKCLPTFVTNTSFNATTSGFYTTTISSDALSSGSLATTLYAISFLYYLTIALIITVSCGLLGSFLTGINDPKTMDPNLFLPLIDNKYLPSKVRNFFRLGVPLITKDHEKRGKALPKIISTAETTPMTTLIVNKTTNSSGKKQNVDCDAHKN